MSSPNVVADAALRMVLETLAVGPSSVAEMPRHWPVTRAIVRAVVSSLADRGLVVEVSRSPQRWQLTESGRAAAATLRTRAA